MFFFGVSWSSWELFELALNWLSQWQGMLRKSCSLQSNDIDKLPWMLQNSSSLSWPWRNLNSSRKSYSPSRVHSIIEIISSCVFFRCFSFSQWKQVFPQKHLTSNLKSLEEVWLLWKSQHPHQRHPEGIWGFSPVAIWNIQYPKQNVFDPIRWVPLGIINHGEHPIGDI